MPLSTSFTDPNPASVPGGIGARVPRVDGRGKVTGAVAYGSDATVRSPLHAYFHTSAIALGRILEIDEREARALPGVVDILTWRNTAGQLQQVTPSRGGSTSIAVLDSPDIRHDGQIVAVILAETYETARDASHRLRVRYDRRAPSATFGSAGLVAEVVKSDARFENPEVGDAEAAFAAAPVRIDQRYATPTQHHNALELFTTTAEWNGDELTVHEPSQFMVGLQHALAATLRIEPSKVRVLSHFAGGAFGSKGGITNRTGLIALAARRTGRPVKMVATRDQSFTVATYRAETRHRVRLAATRDGRITALVHEGEELSSRPDAYKVGGTETTARMYAIPNIASKVTVQHADRNTPGFMRAPAEVPYMFALESAMDELAVALGIDPVRLRRLNDAQVEPVKQRRYSSRSLNECYDAAAAAFGWSRRDPRPMSMTDGDWQIGWGCATACYPSNIAPCFARVALTESGARVEVAGHEIGTGAYTVYAQTAAQLLGLPVGRIEVRMGDSRLPPAPVAGGSNNAASICNAIALACAEVRRMLAGAAVADDTGPLRGRDPATLSLDAGLLRAPDGAGEPLVKALARVDGGVAEASVGNAPKNVPPGALAGLRQGKVAFGGGHADKDSVKYAFGAEFVEVRVHRLTREVRVSRMVGAFAAGTILNPVTARSQLMGGMIWGLGSALHEATEIDHRHARYTNDNLAEYLIPVNADVPEVEVLFVAETDREVNPLGIKGIGELGGVGTNAAICNAIHHATGVRIRELPVRIEQLL
ncbi:MAG: xanthine dehydrogenase family protein molybdopterin-binding subunit [Variovorax sp.]|nr:MAG: xanthine dehydrogenase family protein molybdopterin-binding subunit [Variovorax sp.]